jgi:hypothetical protein
MSGPRMAVFLLAARLCSAGLIPGGTCTSDTMAAFIALGDQGCVTSYPGGVKWSNLSFSGILNGQPVDLSQILVSFREEPLPRPYNAVVAFSAAISNPPPNLDLTVEYTFSIAGSGDFELHSVASGITTSRGTVGLGTYSHSHLVCEGGIYAPDCTGIESANITGLFEITRDHRFASVRTRERWQSTAPLSLFMFTGAALTADYSTPEPNAGAMLALALGGFAWTSRARRRRQK